MTLEHMVLIAIGVAVITLVVFEARTWWNKGGP